MKAHPETAPPPVSNGSDKTNPNNSTTPIPPMMIPPASAAVILGIGERKVWELTNCRAIPSRKIGKSVRYVVWELEAWINAGCPTEPNAADAILRDRSIGGGK